MSGMSANKMLLCGSGQRTNRDAATRGNPGGHPARSRHWAQSSSHRQARLCLKPHKSAHFVMYCFTDVEEEPFAEVSLVASLLVE